MTVQHNGNYLISVLINKFTFSNWFLKNNQIINPKCHVSSIIILIPSFDNKHIINVIVYIVFDVYAQFQRREREEC